MAVTHMCFTHLYRIHSHYRRGDSGPLPHMWHKSQEEAWLRIFLPKMLDQTRNPKTLELPIPFFFLFALTSISCKRVFSNLHSISVKTYKLSYICPLQLDKCAIVQCHSHFRECPPTVYIFQRYINRAFQWKFLFFVTVP